MTARLKASIAGLLNVSGLLRAAEAASDGGNVVFAFHRVLPPGEMDECYNPYLAINPEVFDAFLTWLRGRYAIVALDELLSRARTRTKAKVCALTFDDGWEDNFRVAFPILQQHQAVATIYLATGMIGTQRILPEESLWRLLRSSEPKRKAEIFHSLDPEAEGDSAAAFKRLPYARKMELLTTWKAYPTRERASFLDWAQVKQMSAGGISFGSHTINHVILPLEESSTIKAELAASKKQLEAQLGRVVKDFAFPNGGFDDRTLGLVREAGYEVAVTTMAGEVKACTDPLRIPRLPMDDLVVRDHRGVFSGARARLHIVRGLLAKETAPRLY